MPSRLTSGMSFFFEASGEDSAEPSDSRFLADISDAEWAIFTSHCELRRYAAGSFVARAGELEERSVCVVLTGEVSVLIPGRKRHSAEIRLGDGAVVAEVAFFDGRARTADICAVGDVEMLVLTFAGYERLALREPALACKIVFDLGRALAMRFRGLSSLSGGSR